MESGLCALISPALCFLGHPCLLFHPCCFCALEALDAAGAAACGPLISLSPRAAAQLCLTSLGLWGLSCSQGWAESLRLGVIVTILPALGKEMRFGSSGCALEPGDGHKAVRVQEETTQHSIRTTNVDKRQQSQHLFPLQVLWEQVTPRSPWQTFLPFPACVCWLQFVFSVSSKLSKCFKERQHPLS